MHFKYITTGQREFIKADIVNSKCLGHAIYEAPGSAMDLFGIVGPQSEYGAVHVWDTVGAQAYAEPTQSGVGAAQQDLGYGPPASSHFFSSDAIEFITHNLNEPMPGGWLYELTLLEDGKRVRNYVFCNHNLTGSDHNFGLYLVNDQGRTISSKRLRVNRATEEQMQISLRNEYMRKIAETA